jgi:tetratricopeptide (TPR) repeat protein
MANNAKLRDQARLLEQKESWREAIAAYRQILENPEGANDIGLWNRVGDMHTRLNETEKAVEAYEAAVAAYADAGLHNNAIALCRKILRLVPGRAPVYLKLGQIYAAKGFFADARQNFLEYAERMQRAGKLDASFDALKEFADLSPADTDVRRLLAEQLVSHERIPEAVEQLRILIAQAEEEGAASVAEELRAQIRAVAPDADTSALVRAARAAGKDDFHAVFTLDANPSAPAADPPAGLEPRAGGEISLGEITPLAGLEHTALDGLEPTSLASPAAFEPAPPALPEEGGLSLDFHIEPLDSAPPAADPAPLAQGPELDLVLPGGEMEDGEEEAEPLPLMDVDDFGSPPAVAPVAGLETAWGFSPPLEEEPGDLPLMDFSDDLPPPAPVLAAVPARDRLETLREHYAAAPGDAAVRDELLAVLAERGLGYEGEALLEEGYRALAARAEYPAALDTVAALLRLRPGDATLLQKQVEYAFRSGDRERLVPAYVSLGEHLLASGEETKGLAVFKRVQELDPENARARALLALEPRRAPAPRPPAASAAAAPEGDYIDLGALILDDDRSAPSTRFVVEEREPTGDEDRDFAEMLSHFRQKVAENIEAEDSGSHYDLGLAFKEMGLLDEAIAEFQVALRGGANPLATLELLGQCFVEKGQYAVAGRVLDRALRITGSTDSELIGVLYQLGRTEEAMGRSDTARDFYERVLSIDIRFRDASRRAEALRQASGA